MNPKIINHPAFDADFVAKCQEKKLSDQDTIEYLDAIQSDHERAKAASNAVNREEAVMAARKVGARLGSRKSMLRAQSQ